MSTKWRGAVAAAVIFTTAAVLGVAAKAFVAGSSDVAFAQQARPVVGVAREVLGGRDVGTIVVNGVPVMRMREKYGRWSPYERAHIVSDRLRALAADGLRTNEIRSVRVRGSHVVQARGVDLVTVMPFDAKLVNSSQSELAGVWAANLRSALGRGTAATGGVGTIEGVNYQESDGGVYGGWPSTPAAQWKAPERYDDRWVPIVSFLSGFKLGIARVNGPVSKLKYVQAVAQLETRWKNILEIDIFVPISTEVPGKTLDRVEGCAVTGFVDYDF